MSTDDLRAPDPIKLKFRPGINRENTNYANTGGWFDCNLVRWVSLTAQSMGGWQRFTNTPAEGTFRSLFPFSVLNGSIYYGTGTNLKYYLVQGNTLLDITPIRRTVTLANNPFATTDTTTRVVVTDTAHGAVLNDFVTFTGSVGAVGGVPVGDFNQEHQITEIIDANSYAIVVDTAATSTTTGGGAAVSAEYQINVGLNTSAEGNGWGTGPWGSGGWGEGSSTFVLTDRMRLWSEDNFGEDLVFNVRDGGIYVKDMSGSIGTRAVELSTLGTDTNIPSVSRQFMVSDVDRHAMAFGTNPLGSSTQDRLQIRWSDSEDLTDWTPDTTNSAGGLRLNKGSEIIAAYETTTEIAIFTDISLHSFKYVGPPFIFGEVIIGTNVHLIAPNAAVSTGSELYWMANGLFQMYDGVVRDVPCDVRSYVFGILNNDQTEKIVAGVNRAFKEIIWLMPVNDSSENNFYVILNYENPSDPLWYYGDFNSAGRTTWLDAWFESNPLAGAPDGYIYSHEIGATDNSSGTPVELQSYLQSSVFELGDGTDFMLVSRVIPDVNFRGSSATSPQVTMTFRTQNNPGAGFENEGEKTVTRTVALPVEEYTTKLDKRWRGRSVDMKVSSSETGTRWQLGVPRVYASADGQR